MQLSLGGLTFQIGLMRINSIADRIEPLVEEKKQNTTHAPKDVRRHRVIALSDCSGVQHSHQLDVYESISRINPVVFDQLMFDQQLLTPFAYGPARFTLFWRYIVGTGLRHGLTA